MTKILFLAANPTFTTPLHLDEEVRAVDGALRTTEYRSDFELLTHWAVRYGDLQDLLLRHRPDIVHFSGHGSAEDGLLFLDDQPQERGSASAEILGRLFELLQDNIRCVVLNACYSRVVADVIANHIACVVGMGRAISDPAAIVFATAFYRGLGYGRSIAAAFELALNSLDLANLPEAGIPTLVAPRVDPAQVIFVRAEQQAAAPESRQAQARVERRASNQGLIISGGQVSIGQAAVGDHASVSQYNIAGATPGAARDREAVVLELRKLLQEIGRTNARGALSEEAGTDAEYQLKKALNQAQKPDANQRTILDHLAEARGVVAANAGPGSLLEAIARAIDTVQKAF